MKITTLHLIIHQLDDLFHIDTDSLIGEDMDQLHLLCEQRDRHSGFKTEDNEFSLESSDEDKISALKAVLSFLSRNLIAAKSIDRSLAHFHQERENDIRDFTSKETGDEFSQNEIELLFEVSALWPMTPANLVKDNFDLVKAAALKFQLPAKIDPQLEFEDLLSVGSEALFIAAQKMQESPRENFRSFAMGILKDKMRAHQNNKYPIPQKIKKKLNALKDARSELIDSGYSGSDQELLAKKMNYDPAALADLCEIEAVWGDYVMLDFGDRMEELQIADQSPDVVTRMIEHENDMILSQTMTNLSTMQRNVILNIYYRDQSFRETANALGISLSVVKKHHKNAMRVLKHNLNEDIPELLSDA